MSIFKLVRPVTGNWTLPSLALKENSYRHVHVILSTVLQALRFTHEAHAEASHGDVTAYTGKLHSLLRTINVANTEPHLRLLHQLQNRIKRLDI